MACVIRVKRRIDDDPAEALFLSCKRPRESDVIEMQSVLSFAGTIHSKDEPVSSHIKEAIRRRKINKEIRPHSADFKHSLHLPEVTSQLRKDTAQSSRANRYRVTCSRRALDLDLLDKDADHADANVGEHEKSVSLNRVGCENDVNDSCTENKTQIDAGKIEENSISSSSSQSSHSDANNCKDLSLDTSVHPGRIILKAKQASGHGAQKDVMKEDKMFCMFDLETEQEDDPQKELDQKTTSGITLNNVPMQSSRVTSPPSKEFVYDLYYTHNNLRDLDQEAILTVESLCDELVCERGGDSPDRDLVHDDDDDSNDENNWRADYPDEDPRFYENADEDYDYAEDMVDTNFLRDDDGDLLAYWMDTRCKVDIVSDDGEDEYEDEEGDSSKSSDE